MSQFLHASAIAGAMGLGVALLGQIHSSTPTIKLL